MTPAATIAHLAERMTHARAKVERRYAQASRWLRLRDGYLAAQGVLPPTDPMRDRAADLADFAWIKAQVWTRLAEGEPVAARAIWRTGRRLCAAVRTP